MNRRNISLVVLFLVVSAFSLGSGCSSGKRGGQPPATGPEARLSAGHGCRLLELYVINTKGAPISVPHKGVDCKHGYFDRVAPTMADVQTVYMSQSTIYGPDCRTTFNANGQSYVIQTQQNYCELKAGTITAFVISGNAVISGTQEGSYINGIPGTVSVRLN